MAGERQLESSAQGRAVQRRDHRFRQGLEPQQDVVEQRRARFRVEFPDIRAGDEVWPAAC